MISVRLQLSRRKGFDLQAVSRAANGLPAIVVARPSRWGNPYRVSACHPVHGWPMSREEAVALYRETIAIGTVRLLGGTEAAYRPVGTLHPKEAVITFLRGHNLACWCPLPKPGEPDVCHAAVLLEITNEPERGRAQEADRG